MHPAGPVPQAAVGRSRVAVRLGRPGAAALPPGPLLELAKCPAAGDGAAAVRHFRRAALLWVPVRRLRAAGLRLRPVSRLRLLSGLRLCSELRLRAGLWLRSELRLRPGLWRFAVRREPVRHALRL